jgi:hypothetical protein
MSIFLTVAFFAVLTGIIFWVKNTKTKEAVNPQPTESPAEIAEEINVEEEVLQEKIESPEEMKTRLEAIENPDINKPFAKISKPDVSEIPVEVQPVKKKRKYNKSPKQETTKTKIDENSKKRKNRGNKTPE